VDEFQPATLLANLVYVANRLLTAFELTFGAFQPPAL
jgi:hypothetical protein